MTESPFGSLPEGRRARRVSWPLWRQVRAALKLVQVRLRLPVVLVIAALVVGRWDVIRNHWDKLTRLASSESIALRAVSSDTEYFCPMDPGVVSDWPGKCGICNMALVRRKRGEAVALPDGVIARMQLSPYRIQLAGIQTAPASFRPLVREFESSGVVARARGAATVLLEISARQAPWVAEGQAADVGCADLPGHDPMAGRVRSVARAMADGWEYLRATIAIDDPPRELCAGMIAVARIKGPMAGLEPFRSLPADPPPLTPAEPRQVFVCPDHPGTIMLEPGRCPIERNQREPRPLAEHQRLRWWCPMHPAVTADQAGAVCRACGGMALQPRVVSYHPPGQVLAVPRSAVVDAGARKVVFVESMPGMFDGVEVVVGPRCGDFYPVVRGLEPGQKVATAGAFLLDAETRLNPSLAAGYFGAGRGERTTAPGPRTSASSGTTTAALALQELSPENRSLAERQKLCPVTNKPLGSMGAPTRVVVSGQIVFLCCDGCADALEREPAKYLARLAGPRSP
ncbi:MAG TPA: heavy metal-binding domain-containing protein [Isosphaeraceae bacterium]|nr:heavy metal-binding domain-containing protein [Isosphaeraceae bacterium]